MATARIDAAAVHRSATAKLASVEDCAAAQIEEAVRSLEQEPVSVGALWWRRDHYRTRAEAEAALDLPRGMYLGSERYYIERRRQASSAEAERLRDIAKAALAKGVIHSGIGSGSGDGFVTLDADEVRFLGLQAAA